jgi:hypothetical protein
MTLTAVALTLIIPATVLLALLVDVAALGAWLRRRTK